jgi:hypothetical protein
MQTNYCITNKSYKRENPAVESLNMRFALVCVLLLQLALIEAAQADSKFTYTPGGIAFTWQTFPALPTQDSFTTFTTDLNRDGATDLVITGGTFPGDHEESRGPQPGLILFNNGDNTFTPADGDVPGSESARRILVEDFNNDDVLDIYIADHGYDASPFPGFKNQLLLGTGSGFTDVSQRLPDIKAFTHGAAAGDIDGDGDTDIISLNTDSEADELSYFLINDGDANFSLDRQRLPESLNSTDQDILKQSFSAELADLNGNGFADLVIGREADGRTRIHWNDGAGFFSDSVVTTLEDVDIWGRGVESIAVIEIRAIDVNDDNLLDLLLSPTDQGTFQGLGMQLYVNQGDREFKDETVTRLTNAVRDPNFKGPTFTQFVDVNNDGTTDILSIGANSSANSILLFEGNGDGCFTPISMDEVTNVQDERFRLSLLPVISPAGIAYVEVTGDFGTDNDVIQINSYLPVDIQPNAPIANLFNACRGKLETNIEVDGKSLFSLEFTLFSTTPDVVIQADAASVQELTEGMENLASFSSANGELVLPELAVDGEVAVRNLVFKLMDAGQLLFRLDSFE